MIDIAICLEGKHNGDIVLTDDGDITLTNNLLQNARIAILTIMNEWRLGPDIGLPWYEDILVKNPNTDLIRQEIRDALINVDGVEDATVDLLEFNSAERKISFRFTLIANGETYSEEVLIGG